MIYRLLGLFVVLVLVVAIIPSLKNMYPPIFPEGFQDVPKCACEEGEFCPPGGNKCIKRDTKTATYSGDPEGYFN